MLGDLLAQVPTAAPSGVQKTRPERSGKDAMQAFASVLSRVRSSRRAFLWLPLEFPAPSPWLCLDEWCDCSQT